MKRFNKKLTAAIRSGSTIRLLYLITAVVLFAVLNTPSPTKAEYADVVLNRHSDANDMRPVIFPHWFHRIRFRCKVCHLELGFKMRAGSNNINMSKIADGQFCGACHNGEIAWSAEFCDRCHSGKPGLKAGIRGGSRTAGPGRW